jgi:anti-sigma factor RsiW
VEELLPPYVDGNLTDAETRQVEGHLDGCGACAAFLDYLRRSDAVVLGWPDMPRRMRPQLARIDDAVLPRIRSRSGRPWILAAGRRTRTVPGFGIAVSALLIALVALASLLATRLPGTQTSSEKTTEQQVASISSAFVEDARRSLPAAGERVFDPRAAARARSYLASDYPEGLADFRRVWGDRRAPGPTPAAGTVRADGDSAMVLIPAGANKEVRIRLRLARRDGLWRITKVEPAP